MNGLVLYGLSFAGFRQRRSTPRCQEIAAKHQRARAGATWVLLSALARFWIWFLNTNLLSLPTTSLSRLLFPTILVSSRFLFVPLQSSRFFHAHLQRDWPPTAPSVRWYIYDMIGSSLHCLLALHTACRRPCCRGKNEIKSLKSVAIYVHVRRKTI